jgi:hypothetical protein
MLSFEENRLVVARVLIASACKNVSGEKIEGGSPRKRIVCFRGEVCMLVADGHGARVYTTKGRFDADLSGDRSKVPLAVTP